MLEAAAGVVDLFLSSVVLVLAAAAGGVDFFSFCVAAGAFEFPGAASS